MRMDAQTNSLHYFHSHAVKDRVDLSSYSDTLPTLSNIAHSIEDIFDKVIPSTVDYENLNENLAVLVSRYLIDYVSFFCKH